MENLDYMVEKKIYTAELPKYSWNPYRNINPINNLNDEKMIVIGDEEISVGTLKMKAFLLEDTDSCYNKDYIDIIIDPRVDKELKFLNTIISYKYSNKNIEIKGLPIGEYMIQLYTVKNGHDGNYKIITNEDYDSFYIDTENIDSEKFDKENNIYKIDCITTSTSNEGIQVDIDFMTKMERKIKLTTDNLRSNLLPNSKIAEKNEETEEKKGIEEDKKIILKESTKKNILFPLDIVFVIDNSKYMQQKVDAIKDGLRVFGEKLYSKGFDVKYNLITFGPEQTSDRIGDWNEKIYSYENDNYMAIYKEKWFDGSTLGQVNYENKKEKELDELIDAFSNIKTELGYLHGQENSAWGIHYAIKKIRANGRYLDSSGNITDESNDGDIPSEKMIIFLTDENMDTRDKFGKNTLESIGYDHENVLEKLYSKLNFTYNGMANNIKLVGLFHVKRRGNTAIDTNLILTRYKDEGVPNLGYKYSWGINKNNSYWEEWDDREIPILGIDPSDRADVYHTDFKLYNTENNFFMYEMGQDGENVRGALLESINNIGIVQRWRLSYITPFNKYDGTTRTVDFKLIDLVGIDGKNYVPMDKVVKNLDDPIDNKKAKIEDRQYTVQGKKIVVEFKDPVGSCPKLNIVDKRGVIKFLARSRYYETNGDGEDIIIQDIIKDYNLNILKTDGTLLFNRNKDSIDMSLGEDGWYEFKVVLTDKEMDIIRDGKLDEIPIEYINLEATATNDLFTETKILEDVEIDLTPPMITEIKLVNTTLKEFFKSMVRVDGNKLFTDTEIDNYSGYSIDNSTKFSSILNYSGSCVKTGDLIDITLTVEDKNLNKNNIYRNIGNIGWGIPIIEKEGKHKFKVRWEKIKIKDSCETISIRNTMEDNYGNIGDQKFDILKIDNTEIVPEISILDKNDDPIAVHLSDGKYYVNENYNIELSKVDDRYLSGILAFKYNKTKADLDLNNSYYGVSTFYHYSPKGFYTGGIKETDGEIEIDQKHKTDGEYIGKVYGMSKSGKLISIDDYCENNFDKILDLNYDKTPLAKTTIVVDTIAPEISNVSIINKTFMKKYKVNSVDNSNVTYVKDKDQIEVSFDIKDFNLYLQEIGEKEKGGYLLEIEDLDMIDSLVGTIKRSEDTSLIDTYTVTYNFVIKDPSKIERDIEFYIKGEDKAGNEIIRKEILTLNNSKPKDVTLKVYEEVKSRENITTQRVGDKDLSVNYNGEIYKFTKGGPGSLTINPVIFAKIYGTGADIRYLKIYINKNIDLLLDILETSTNEIKIDDRYNKFLIDSMNVILVTPISISGVEGDDVKFKFILDTRVNTSYLQDKIIGDIVEEKIEIDLSLFKELVGIDGYSYVFTIGGKIVDSGNSGKNSNGLNGNSFSTIQGKSIDNTIEIDTSKFNGGSRGDLKITVWDRLGHEKIFSKIYFIPTKSLGIKATVENQTKQRESKIRIIGEGSDSKLILESILDRNSE